MTALLVTLLLVATGLAFGGGELLWFAYQWWCERVIERRARLDISAALRRAKGRQS